MRSQSLADVFVAQDVNGRASWSDGGPGVGISALLTPGVATTPTNNPTLFWRLRDTSGGVPDFNKLFDPRSRAWERLAPRLNSGAYFLAGLATGTDLTTAKWRGYGVQCNGGSRKVVYYASTGGGLTAVGQYPTLRGIDRTWSRHGTAQVDEAHACGMLDFNGANITGGVWGTGGYVSAAPSAELYPFLSFGSTLALTDPTRIGAELLLEDVVPIDPPAAGVGSVGAATSGWLFLGDSITAQGTASPSTIAAYRLPLDQAVAAENPSNLTAVRYVAVGTLSSPAADFITGQCRHEGHNGYTSTQIYNGLAGWKVTWDAQLAAAGLPLGKVFLHIGTNDWFGGTPLATTIAKIAAIVDWFATNYPGAIVYLARIIPTTISGKQALVDDINTYAVDPLASRPNVVIVNMADMPTSYIYSDGSHPILAGCQWMSDRNYAAAA